MTNYMVVSVAGIEGLPALKIRVKDGVSNAGRLIDFVESFGYTSDLSPTIVDISKYYSSKFHDALGDGEGTFDVRDKADENGKVVKEWYIVKPLT